MDRKQPRLQIELLPSQADRPSIGPHARPTDAPSPSLHEAAVLAHRELPVGRLGFIKDLNFAIHDVGARIKVAIAAPTGIGSAE